MFLWFSRRHFRQLAVNIGYRPCIFLHKHSSLYLIFLIDCLHRRSTRIGSAVTAAQYFFDLFDRIPVIDNTSTEGQELVREFEREDFPCNYEFHCVDWFSWRDRIQPSEICLSDTTEISCSKQSSINSQIRLDERSSQYNTSLFSRSTNCSRRYVHISNAFLLADTILLYEWYRYIWLWKINNYSITWTILWR